LGESKILVDIIGLDIGGANTKAAFVKTNHESLHQIEVIAEYFPIWKYPTKLADTLLKIRERLNTANIEGVGVTMTAELSDAYQTKEEGVKQILACVAKVFADTTILVLDADATLRSLTEALSEPLKVASANWAATGWMVSQLVENCVVIDVGSTSTSIIPVVAGRIAAFGKTDLEKLINGELVYTGALRTNVAAIVPAVPLKGGWARVSSELFAQSSDVNLVLGNIEEEEYTVETADGRGKTRFEAMARLSRVVCADANTLSEGEILDIADCVYKRQIEHVTAGLTQVLTRVKSVSKTDIVAVVTGVGKDFIARKAAKQAGFREIVDLGELIQNPLATKASPALGVALMVANKIEGKRIKWMQ
jgi:probable H4MPT-linked C1 transfer pathway protein